jgi:hypothetical protein
LWLWLFSAFERKKSKIKSATPAMQELDALWLRLHAEKHIKVARSTFASKFVERLFYDLLAAR